jgi:cyclin-dependent kinase 7
MEEYKKIRFIGRGTFAIVYKAKHISSKNSVALKKFQICNKDYGVTQATIREIKTMREIVDNYVINFVDYFISKNNFSLVLEFMDGGSLEEIIYNRVQNISEGDTKTFMYMLLQGLSKLHMHSFVHRDVKPNNLLLSSSGILKLADFGLSRTIGSPGLKYSPTAFVDYYRPIEMLFGIDKYTKMVDLWAAGCVFAELLIRKPIFYMKDHKCHEIPLIKKIFSVLGTPNDQSRPKYSNFSRYMCFKFERPSLPFRSYLRAQGAKDFSDDLEDLLTSMLKVNPTTRISANEALMHRFFYSGIKPTTIKHIPRMQRIVKTHHPILP